MMPTTLERVQHEIEHGRKLAAGGAESIWGWETPVGQRRAQRRAQLICEGAHLQPGQHVLEIGCGTGNFTERFAQHDIHLTAVDISPDLLDQARRRPITSKRVRFLEARFEDLTSEKSFDAIIGSSILHHLEIEAALANIFRLLKPGGRMCFAEPNMLNPHVYLLFNFAWSKKRWGVSPDEKAFFRWPLHRLLQASGFEEIRVRPFDFLHPYTPAPLLGMVAGLGRVFENLPLIREIAGSHFIQARKPLGNTQTSKDSQ